MNAPEIPENEESRLKALRSLDILDTASEERFDRLTRIAKRMFDVPIALISLVDENRQWFKACIGLDVKETGRDVSFCGHTILGNDVFIIEDATKDERFADNPLVTSEPNIRFYAGCPLRFTDGMMLGTLCIIDDKPRKLSQDDLEALRDLGATAERELAAVHLATIDELTQVTNRRGFSMIAKHSLKLCVRKNISASLVYLDLDSFKAINDQFGHDEGDSVLVALTDQINQLCRDSDIATRLGGDEFAILHVNANKEDVEAIIERLQHSLDQYNQTQNKDYDISFSFGIVEFDPERHSAIEELLKDADDLMYKHKKSKYSPVQKRIGHLTSGAYAAA